jgi:hypothetical protein
MIIIFFMKNPAAETAGCKIYHVINVRKNFFGIVFANYDIKS